MRYLHQAELRGSWRAWLAVSLAFVVTNFALSLSLLCYFSGTRAVARGDMTSFEGLGTNMIFMFNAIMCAIVGVAVISSAAELVVASRRGSIARLALAGASPGQIIGTLMTQLVAVSLASAVVGDIAALLAQKPLLDVVMRERAGDGATGLTPIFSPVPLLLAALGMVVVALLGGYVVARRAATIPAVDALREAAQEQPVKITVWRVVRFVIVALLVLAFAIGSLIAMGTNDYQKGDQIVQGGVLVLILVGVALSTGGLFIVGPLTRAWTRLVPGRDPAWFLARNTVIVRGTRMAKTVVPVMMTIGILVGMLVVGETMAELIRLKWGPDAQINAGSFATLLMIMGLPFLVSLSGAVGNLIMMSRQRHAELALTGLSGATPDQQTRLLVLEGVIVAVTATILGLIMVSACAAYIYVGVGRYLNESAMGVPWASVALVVGACLVLCVVTTTLPSLKALREPPQKVVARLIAD